MVRSFWMGAVVGALAWTGPAWSQTPGGEQTLVVSESGRPAQKCKVLRTWVAKDGSRMHEVQALDTGEKMTIQEPPAGPAAPRHLFPLGHRTAPAPAAPAPPPGPAPAAEADYGRLAPVPQSGPPKSPYATRPVKVAPAAAPVGEQQDSLLKRIFLPSPPAPAPAQGQSAQPGHAAGAVPYPQVKVEPSSAGPRDWRESWGKVDRHSYAKETNPAVRPAALTKSPPPADPAKTSPQTPSPSARTEPEAAAPPAPLGMGSIAAVRSPMLREEAGEGPNSLTPGPNAFTEVAEAPPQAPPQGAGPVPYPAMPVRYPVPYPGRAPAGPVMAMDQGVPAGLANAFTAGGTSRPIPADFGPHPGPGNAFVDPTGGMPAPAAMLPPAPPGPVMVYTPQGLVLVSPPAYPQGMPVPAQSATATASAGAEARRLLSALKDSALPSEREMAVEQLSACDWRAQPQVVQALLSAAREDPAPLVRAGCVRALGRMRVNTVSVYQAVQTLKDDPDLRVRREAEQALGAMSGR